MKNIKIITLMLSLIIMLCGFTDETPVPVSSLDDEPLDYSDAENWIIFGEGEDTDADFFFLAPTVSTGETYNMTLDDPSVLSSFLAQTNVFRDIYGTNCRTYSPVYRQETTAVFNLPIEEWEPYRDFAYQDVSAHGVVIAGADAGGERIAVTGGRRRNRAAADGNVSADGGVKACFKFFVAAGATADAGGICPSVGRDCTSADGNVAAY